MLVRGCRLWRQFVDEFSVAGGAGGGGGCVRGTGAAPGVAAAAGSAVLVWVAPSPMSTQNVTKRT